MSVHGTPHNNFTSQDFIKKDMFVKRSEHDKETPITQPGMFTFWGTMLLGPFLMMETPELMLPHPAMGERRFVLEPLAEIAGGMVHPVTGLSVARIIGGTGRGST